ncbi:hypothetical protein DIPPA_52271, partial [Diplonema papillatum]
MRAVLLLTALSAASSSTVQAVSIQSCTLLTVHSNAEIQLFHYENNMNLCWQVSCAAKHANGVLVFRWMDTELDYDILAINDVPHSGNTTVPPTYFNGSVAVKFASDSDKTGLGFSVTATCTLPLTVAPPTIVPPTISPPTYAPPTDVPPTYAPPTDAPPTLVPQRPTTAPLRCIDVKVQREPVTVALLAYTNNMEECWIVKCDAGEGVLAVVFLSMDTEPGYDHVYVDDVPYSGNSTLPPPTSSDGSVRIGFVSDADKTRTGFLATATCSVRCTHIEVLADPVAVDLLDYENSMNVCWLVTCEADAGVGILVFSWIDTELEYDVLRVDNFPYTGNSTVPPPKYFNKSVALGFTSDAGKTASGFSATVTCTVPDTVAPPTNAPPTHAPPTDAPLTSAPPTNAPLTYAPPTD